MVHLFVKKLIYPLAPVGKVFSRSVTFLSIRNTVCFKKNPRTLRKGRVAYFQTRLRSPVLLPRELRHGRYA
jgi:hypothetical protein